MKKNNIIIAILLTLILTSCGTIGAEKDQDDEGNQLSTVQGSPEITFKTHVKDLGSIKEGEQVMTYFRYENTGEAPLLISTIKAGCGCTVPEWNKKPVEPGDVDDIKVIFDSSGKNGNQNIRISVNSNARNPVMTLIIKGIVSQ